MSLVKLLQIAKEVDTSLELTVFSTAELFNDDCTVKVISIFFNLDKDNLYDLSAVSAILNVHKMEIICAKTIHFVRSLATGRSGPRGSGWIKAPDFVTFRYYKGGRSSAKRTGRLYPRGNPWYSLSEAELTSGHMVLLGVPRKKSSVTPQGIDPGTVRLVAQCLNHYATPGPLFICYSSNLLVWASDEMF